MIRLVFNGYYRSGTTVMYRILKESNADMLALYEPLHPRLFGTDIKGRSLLLHGFNPWSCYQSEPFKRIEPKYRSHHEALKKKHGGGILPFEFKEIEPLFDLLHSLEVDVILQPNNCHFVLSGMAEKYGCKTIHIIRNPVDVWISATLSLKAKEKLLAKLIYDLRTTFLGRYVVTKYLSKQDWIGLRFSLNVDYRRISKRFGIEVDDDDYLAKMLVNWTICNYHAFKQSDGRKGMCVYYEEVATNPAEWLKAMSDFSGLNFDLNHVKIIEPKITRDKKLRKFFVEKLEKIGLLDLVKEFYPPERWFTGGC